MWEVGGGTLASWGSSLERGPHTSRQLPQAALSRKEWAFSSPMNEPRAPPGGTLHRERPVDTFLKIRGCNRVIDKAFCVKLSTIYNRSTSSGFFFSPGIKSQQYLRGEDLAQEEAGPQEASGGGSGVEKGRLKSFLHLRPWLCDSSRPHGLQPTRLLLPWDFPGESTGVGCHCLLRRKKFF